MRIDPALRALRDDPLAQREARRQFGQSKRELLAGARWQRVLGALERYGAGAALDGLAALAELFEPGAVAGELAADFIGQFVPLLARYRLGALPFRHAGDARLSSLLLAQSGRAMLLLVAQEPGAREHGSVVFGHGERRDAVLAGAAEARIVGRRGDAGGRVRLGSEGRRIAAGDRLTLDQAQEALLLDRVATRLVSLRLLREGAPARPMRRYRLADGAFERQAAGSVDESRQALMLALLGQMRCAKAAPLMAEMAREGSDALRWQALRQCLALDTARGFRALCAIAGDRDDPLAAHAAVLRAHLVESHPVLAALEGEAACPA